MNHTYEKCYSLLNINAECSWEDLRKSYRTLIQKWHPDRCSGDVEKALATNKLKDLNTAYKQLSDYYDEHDVLPPLSPNVIPSPPPIPTQSHQNDEKKFNTNKPSHDSSTNKQNINSKRKTKSRHLLTFTFASIMIVIGYQYIDTIFESSSTPYDFEKKSPQTINKSVPENKAKNKKKIKDEAKDKYFTYGSTIGEVILIQGPPDKMLGNIWFYGNSEIHFKDGFVIDWRRTVNNPLKALALVPDNKKSVVKSQELDNRYRAP